MIEDSSDEDDDDGEEDKEETEEEKLQEGAALVEVEPLRPRRLEQLSTHTTTIQAFTSEHTNTHTDVSPCFPGQLDQADATVHAVALGGPGLSAGRAPLRLHSQG